MTQQLKPFQRVLVRDSKHDDWRCSIFSHIKKDSPYKYVTTDSAWEKCIPYEGNERLTGTSDSPVPPEPEFEFGDKVEVSDDDINWYRALYISYKPEKKLSHAAIREARLMHSFWKYCRKADW